MWAEIIFSGDDLKRLLDEALPLTIHLGDLDAEHSLTLSELSEVALVADTGLRLVCKARVHWPLLGIDVPVSLKSLTLVLLSAIGQSAEGDTLVFRVAVEQADFSALPAAIGDRIAVAINSRLAEKDAQLSWNFSRALTYAAALPPFLEPLASFDVRPAWGKVRITEEALVYAASFHSSFVRRGAPTPDRSAPLGRPSAASRPLASRPTRDGVTARQMVTAGIFGLAAGGAYFVLRSALHPGR